MIEKLQYITHEKEGLSHWEQAELACSGGCRWIQLRIKDKSDSETAVIAKKVQNVCLKFGATFIINDNVELVHEILADGVHLGKSDMTPENARKILGDNFIIGGTANTFEEIKKLVAEKIDYIGLGPFRFTSTKQKLSPILGIEGYDTIIAECRKHQITIPIIAIGGILLDDIHSLMNTGVYGIAISSAINSSKDMSETTRNFCLHISNLIIS